MTNANRHSSHERRNNHLRAERVRTINACLYVVRTVSVWGPRGGVGRKTTEQLRNEILDRIRTIDIDSIANLEPEHGATVTGHIPSTRQPATLKETL